MAKLKLTEQQQAAVENRGGSLLVSAAAGSGKTKVLVDRLLSRILDEQDAVLGESGLIRPGEYVQAVKLDTVPRSTANVSLKIMAYEPETYYSAGSARLKTVLTVA